MTEVIKGVDIKREEDGSFAIHFSGRGLTTAIKGGFASEDAARAYLDGQTEKLVADIRNRA